MAGIEEDERAEYEALLASGEKIARSVTKNQNPEDVKDLKLYGVGKVFHERLEHPDRLTTRDQRERFLNKVIRNKHIMDGIHDDVARKNEGEMIRRMEANQSPIGQPEKEFDAKVLAGIMGEALAEVTPHYRRIATMMFYQGCSFQKISDATGVAVETLRVQMGRALGRMERNETLAAYNKLWVTE
jgi:RNA polymerase sigma factor (sigma-70 family)